MRSKKIKKTTRKKREPRPLGAVAHYFDKINVAVIKLKSSLKIGDFIKFQTKEGSFTQIVESMQVNHKYIRGARKGSEIGLKTLQKVKEGNLVFKAEAPKPIVIEEKIEYQPLFSMEPERSKPKPSSSFSHPLIKDKSSKPLQKMVPDKPVRPYSEPQRAQPQKKPSGYSEVKFLKF